jgi:hypothetical protein
MTVADLIARLSQYPADLAVCFRADGGRINKDEPIFWIEQTSYSHFTDSDQERQVINTLIIETE